MMLFTSAKNIQNVGASPETSAMIHATGVHKTFRTGKIEVHALRGINLSVQRGEMVAIMGPSGCGKTTLLNCLSGLDEFDEGEVLIEGTNIRQMGDRRRTAYRAARMGFVFQTYNLLPVITAVENVELPLLVSGVAPSEARRRALAALERVDLGHRAHHRPAELSGGQRQRVTIARSLVNDPAIVWADEPTGNLDSKTAQDIMDLMRQLNRDQQQTFVIVTHDPAIGAQCDRIVRMQDGLIIGEEIPSGNAQVGEDLAGEASTTEVPLAAKEA
jgi:ABC-type lipoprotein export system ATPase subunit